MRLQLTMIDTLPRLSWCAMITRSYPEMRVWHGPWVETFNDGFVEGAWDGEFDEFNFDESASFAGTGGRVRGSRFVFTASINTRERLFLVRQSDALIVSNSLVFVLVIAGDRPDPGFRYYSGELLVQNLLGMQRKRRSLPMTYGSVEIYEYCDLEVDSELGLRQLAKQHSQPPLDFMSCRQQLSDAIGLTLDNARDPARKYVYEPVVALSRGYDSPMIAAIARERGCKNALTFADSPWRVERGREDDGTQIARALGLETARHHRRELDNRTDFPEAEFCVLPPGMDYLLASMEGSLKGKILLTGLFGDSTVTADITELGPKCLRPSILRLWGTTLTEFRLRVGFLHYPPMSVIAQHYEAIYRISTSDAMKAWSVGGGYDRPIARRILYEAGVPAEMFAQNKSGGVTAFLRSSDELTKSSRTDFLQFCADHPELRYPPARYGSWLVFSVLLRFRRKSPLAKIAVMNLPSQLWLYSRPPFERLLFQWGFDRTRRRYDAALSDVEIR